MTDEMKGRLYVVSEVLADKDGVFSEKIVEANSKAQAIQLVVGARFAAKPATARDVARIMGEQYERQAGIASGHIGTGSGA